MENKKLHPDFSVYDNAFDAIIVFDKKGLIQYANPAFYLFSTLSPSRVINKLDITKIFNTFDDHPVNLNSFLSLQESTSIKVVKFTTKSIENGLGQYAISVIDDYFIFFFKDLTIEEDLHRKYRREMGLKDKKIEEMDSLIKLLQNTRLVKEERKILEEFTKHLLNHFGLGIGFLKDSHGNVYKVLNSKQIGPSTTINHLQKDILEFPIFETYTFYENRFLMEKMKTFSQHMHSLVILPINAQGKDHYEIFIPIHNEEKSESFDHQQVITLAEQMNLLIQNMVLEKLSIYDDLTKVHNSRFFREKLNEYTKHFERMNLILMDIDFFKKINDTYGHPGGDAVLIHVGQILKSFQEKEILVSRVGGEEFAILVPNASLEEALDIASRMSDQIRSAEVHFDNKIIKVTMSFGISNWNPEKMLVRDFYKKADEALYESKANGRDRITVLNNF